MRDDLLGEVFRHDLTAQGVRFDTPAATEGPATARCLILVTSDGQRTMNTFLGACVELGPDDIDPDIVGAAQVAYLEGYLFDPPLAQQAFRRAAAIAHAAGKKVALSLSDPFCVDRHRSAFRDLVAGHVDILFANEVEICSLYETHDFAAAATAVRGHVAIAALTRSAEGSVILANGQEHRITASAGRARRRHHRRRRSLCRRLSLWFDPRIVAPHLWRDRQFVRCRNNLPMSAPGPSELRELVAATGLA